MKKWSKLIKPALLVCVLAAALIATPSSLAYLATNSNTVENTFHVTLQPPKDIVTEIVIHKTMINLSDEEIGPGGFNFCLLDLQTNAGVNTTTMDNGYAFLHLSFTHEDIGKTFRYWLYEVDDARENVTYDKKVYEIEIMIGLSDMNEITADCTIDGKQAHQIMVEFENTYFVPVIPPDTGDNARPALWAAMMVISAAGLAVIQKKRCF